MTRPLCTARSTTPPPGNTPPKADAQTPAAPVGAKGYIGLFGDSAIAVVDIVNERVLKTLPVTAPDGLVITPDGKKVYVSCTDTGKVQVIDTATDTLSGSIDVGSKPAGLAVTHDGKQLVVAVGGSNEAVIDRVGLEAILGFDRRGDTPHITPVVPTTWPSFRIEYRRGKACTSSTRAARRPASTGLARWK